MYSPLCKVNKRFVYILNFKIRKIWAEPMRRTIIWNTVINGIYAIAIDSLILSFGSMWTRELVRNV